MTVPTWLHVGPLPAWLLLLFVVLDAIRQGILTWHLREYVPAGRLDWLDASLHAGGALAYGLVVLALVPHPGLPWLWAALLRWLLFDVVLMLTWNYVNHREGRAWEPLFKVGTAAWTDRATRWLAARLRQPPSVVRAASFGLAAALAGVLALLT